MKIKNKEIKITIRNVLLSICSFYLVFPLREFINNSFKITENLGGQFILGIVGILIVAYIFNIE